MFSPCAVNGPSHGKPFATPDRMLPRSLHRQSQCSSDTAFFLNVRFAPIVLKKSFLTDGRIFLGPLVRCSCGDVRQPHRFTQKRPQTAVSALQSVAAAQTTKNQHSRDFRGCSIFDFCNSIRQQRLFANRTLWNVVRTAILSVTITPYRRHAFVSF